MGAPTTKSGRAARRGSSGRLHLSKLTGFWKDLAKEYGTVQALADALEVSRTTLRRWSEGAPCSGAVGKRVQQLARRRGLDFTPDQRAHRGRPPGYADKPGDPHAAVRQESTWVQPSLFGDAPDVPAATDVAARRPSSPPEEMFSEVCPSCAAAMAPRHDGDPRCPACADAGAEPLSPEAFHLARLWLDYERATKASKQADETAARLLHEKHEALRTIKRALPESQDRVVYREGAKRKIIDRVEACYLVRIK